MNTMIYEMYKEKTKCANIKLKDYFLKHIIINHGLKM